MSPGKDYLPYKEAIGYYSVTNGKDLCYEHDVCFLLIDLIRRILHYCNDTGNVDKENRQDFPFDFYVKWRTYLMFRVCAYFKREDFYEVINPAENIALSDNDELDGLMRQENEILKGLKPDDLVFVSKLIASGLNYRNKAFVDVVYLTESIKPDFEPQGQNEELINYDSGIKRILSWLIGSNEVNSIIQDENDDYIYGYEMNTLLGDRGIPAIVFGFRVIEKNGKKGLIDRMGKYIIPAEYDRIYLGSFFWERAVVGCNQRYGYMDINGNIVVDLKYDFAGDFYQYKGLVELNGKYGFVNLYSEQTVPCKYEDIFIRSGSDMIPAKLSGKWGYIDLYDKVLIPFQFDEVTDYEIDTASVMYQGKKEKIDLNGNIHSERKK